MAFVALSSGQLFCQGCACEGAEKSSSEIIPIEVIQNNVFVPVTIVQKGHCTTGSFNLDTGTTRTVIDTDVAISLKLAVKGAEKVTKIYGARLVPLAQVDCLRIGQAIFKNTVVGIEPEKILDERYQHPVTGLLGIDFLQGGLTRIDFKRKELTLGAKSPQAGTPKADVPLHFFRAIPAVTCVLPASLKVDLLVDSGYDGELKLFGLEAARVSLEPNGFRTGYDSSGRGAVEIAGFANSVACSDLVLGKTDVAAVTTSEDRPGLFGNVILSRYTVELDLRANRLRLY